MTITAERIGAYIDPANYVPVELRDYKGRRVGHVELSELWELVAANVICGVGTWTRLKHVRYLYDEEEVAKRRKEDRSTRSTPVLDNLMKMVNGRKFVIRRHVMVDDPISGEETKTGLWYWEFRRI